MTKIAFDFGKNWERYSDFLTTEQLQTAQKSLSENLGPDGLRNKSFIDIGCGSGIFSICAGLLGSKRVVGMDVNDKCVEISRKNSERFINRETKPEFIQESILNREGINKLGRFDVVYAWGSLHHTGDMKKAIEISSQLVNSGGIFWLAIYNKHFSSPLWKRIKYFYNHAGIPVRKMMVYFFLGVIFIAKFLVTFKNPLAKERGMDFFYDVVDWVGGYPYEYASTGEIVSQVEELGFRTLKVVPAEVPTGCNEYLFLKKS